MKEEYTEIKEAIKAYWGIYNSPEVLDRLEKCLSGLSTKEECFLLGCDLQTLEESDHTILNNLTDQIEGLKLNLFTKK